MIVDRRAHFSKGLSPLYLPYYEALCALLPSCWQPVSGYRDFQLQTRIYALGRTSPGAIVTKAKPGFSFHNYGLASDWSYFEGNRYTPIDAIDPRWDEYTAACNKAGVTVLSWERPHNQLKTRVTISEIFMEYESGGLEAVDNLLRR